MAFKEVAIGSLPATADEVGPCALHRSASDAHLLFLLRDGATSRTADSERRTILERHMDANLARSRTAAIIGQRFDPHNGTAL